jgi:uncharacterized protein YbgA (DUF1722 family)/uncharacterized protein YbbK (DUF523 family)
MLAAMKDDDTIYIGISACLLGEKVRYDGGHKNSDFCSKVLAPFVSYVPVCPEMGIGMGAPREAIHLQGEAHGSSVRAVGNRSKNLDVTEKLEAYGRAKADELDYLCGYILMGRSPSCGMERIKVYGENGMPVGRSSSGIYAREFMARYPLLPVEEEGRLNDVRLRENFVARIYAWRRWQLLNRSGLSHATLQDFHARHKYLLLAHNQASYRTLGRIVALAHQRPLAAAAADYISLFMATLKVVASNSNHSNVLTHIMGYLKHQMDAASKQELIGLIDQFRLGRVPLIAPLTLLKHHFRQYPNAYIARQYYLEPHPPELMLRNFH